MLGTIVLVALILYFLAALVALWLNLGGPVTPGLALLRAALWPLWLMGYVEGERQRMD